MRALVLAAAALAGGFVLVAGPTTRRPGSAGRVGPVVVESARE